MSRWSVSVGVGALLSASAAFAQFPLGPGVARPQPVVDPAINEYICRAVVEHATTSIWNPICSGESAVELVSARYQGDLVFVFSRVYWNAKSPLHRKPRQHAAEVQYSMVQRRFQHCVYEIWFCETYPRIYQYYDLGRIRTRINDELGRFDRIAGDDVFPGPYRRGPSTIVPQVVLPGSSPATGNPNTPSADATNGKSATSTDGKPADNLPPAKPPESSTDKPLLPPPAPQPINPPKRQ
jgi:hypothetical protein